ncbi:hypothetical protein AB9F41_34900, partial [Rhizobium leguminosarum]
MTLRIISLNAWGGRLHEALIEALRQLDIAIPIDRPACAEAGCAQNLLQAQHVGIGRRHIFNQRL